MLDYRHPWPVLIERGKDLWGVIILGLPGCQGAAETLDEALGMLNETVEDHIAVLKEFGDTVPDPPPGPRFIKVLLDQGNAEDFGPDWDESLEYEQWIKVPKAARLIGCSQDTVKNYIKDGRLPAYQPGRDYLLRLSDVIKFIHSSLVKPEGSQTTEAA